MSDIARGDTLARIGHEFGVLREQAERALRQIDDTAFVATLGGEDNSLAVLVKHVAGNLRSRWTDPFTTDGEKPDRRRDTEFEITDADTRAAVMARWAEAFTLVGTTLGALSDADLDRPVTIRGQAQPLRDAALRSLTHTATHVGQIVLLAKHLAGPAWTTLSIPRGQSEAFLQAARQRTEERGRRTEEGTKD